MFAHFGVAGEAFVRGVFGEGEGADGVGVDEDGAVGDDGFGAGDALGGRGEWDMREAFWE